MNRTFLLASFLVVAAASAAPAQVPPDKAEATFKVVDGLEFKLWASEPLFANPTCIDIDHKGRVWVCESVNYRCTLLKKPLNRKEGDRIVILEDSKGEGKADKATTFYQSPELLAPLGIAVAKDPEGPGYKVYVCQSPDILVFTDSNGEGKADGPPKKLLTGFQGIDHDHGVHGILIGPDMKLYFSVGDQGVKDLQSSDGKGRKWTSNNTDCRAGTIWRCEMDGKNLELIAHNFRNEYEPCVDSFGTIFTSDNDDDGNEQTRICYVMPGGNYGYHPRGPGQSHWHEEQPGVVPKILRTGFGSPTGMCVYEGTLLPFQSPERKRAGFTTQLLHTDAGPREVRCYHLKPDGAGYQVEKEVLVSSTDTWFRPSDICVAPDGSAFVADWYDPGVGGHGMGDTTRGRIYRLAPKGNKPSVPKVDLNTKEGLAAASRSPAISVQHMVRQKCEPMKLAQLLPNGPLEEMVVDDLALRVRWASILGRKIEFKPREKSMVVNPKAWEQQNQLEQLFGIRFMKEFTGRTIADNWPAAQQVIGISTVPTRRELLLVLRDVEPSKATPCILELAKQYDGKDRFYLAAIGIAVGQDPKRREIILADFDKEFPEWNEKVAGLVWELRPPKMMPVLEKQLASGKPLVSQQKQIIDILANTDDPAAGKHLLCALQPDAPAEVRDWAVDKFKDYLPNKWKDLRFTNEMGETIDRLLDEPRTRIAGLTLIGASHQERRLNRVADIAGNTREPVEVRIAAIQTLGNVSTEYCVPRLEKLLQTEPAALRSEVIKALGQLSGADPAAGDRIARGAPESLKVLQDLMTGTDESLQRAAIPALAASRTGSIWLLELNDKKELPEKLKPDVGSLLRNSLYKDLRNKAMIAFPPAAKLDPKKLPSAFALAGRKGNAKHGEELMAASAKSDLQCLKCHTVRSGGGQIGPDLSKIGVKASRENLFESILEPSKAIADQYLTWNIETKKGLSLSGLIVEDTAEFVTLRDANGKDTRVAVKDIDTRKKSQVSLMPADLLAYMSEDDLVDLVEYLFALK